MGKTNVPEVIDREKRPPRADRKRLRMCETNKQRRRQSGAARRGKGIDFRDGDIRFAQSAAHDLGQRREVIPRRDLGHHAAIRRVNLGCDQTTLESNSPVPRITAAAVSSQDVSRARTTAISLNPWPEASRAPCKAARP